MSNLIEARYTTDPSRVRILQKNYDEGVQREKMERKLREQEDVEILSVSHAGIVNLHMRALRARLALQKRRGKASRRDRNEDEDEEDSNEL